MSSDVEIKGNKELPPSPACIDLTKGTVATISFTEPLKMAADKWLPILQESSNFHMMRRTKHRALRHTRIGKTKRGERITNTSSLTMISKI